MKTLLSLIYEIYSKKVNLEFHFHYHLTKVITIQQCEGCRIPVSEKEEKSPVPTDASTTQFLHLRLWKIVEDGMET